MLLTTFCGLSLLVAQPEEPAPNSHYFLPPPSFETKEGEKAQFVDFGWARHMIEFNAETKKVQVVSHIVFKQWEEGFPLFDLVPNPTSVFVDGQEVQTKLIGAPDRETSFRIVLSQQGVGEHHMVIRHELTKGVKFSNGGVSAGFWYSDLDDREFLEQYLPTNLEFDQYMMSFRISLVGTTQTHRVFTNGRVQVVDENNFYVRFSDDYNTSGPFFHLAPLGEFQSVSANFKSMDGRDLPVVVYMRSSGFSEEAAQEYLDTALSVLPELEKDYGPFPHPSLLVYANPSFPGGMEYAGATITNLWALPHEISHSYFGRGIMPANGNAGWIDEALASWRDENYKRRDHPGFSSGRLASFSPYKRVTVMDAYTKGRNFMSFLDYRISEKDPTKGLKTFLRKLINERVFKVFTTGMFKNLVEEYLGESLEDDFGQYVYGKGRMERWTDGLNAPERAPFHPAVTEEMLRSLL